MENNMESKDIQTVEVEKEVGKEIETKSEKKKDNKFLILIIILLIGIIAGGAYYITHQKTPIYEAKVTKKYDTTADGSMSDKEAADKNKKLEAGMMNITISSNPSYSEGVLYLNMKNKEMNTSPQVLELMLVNEDGTNGEILFQSGAVPVGKYLNQVETKLSKDLKPGEYKCTAMFRGINAETGELMGSAAARVTLTVL